MQLRTLYAVYCQNGRIIWNLSYGSDYLIFWKLNSNQICFPYMFSCHKDIIGFKQTMYKMVSFYYTHDAMLARVKTMI